MPISYINSPDSDFSYGMDARSAENQISAGFVRDLLNADIVEKRVKTRPGYQGFAGNLPVRATGIQYIASTGQMLVTLDSSVALNSPVSLETVRSTPLVIYGRTSHGTTGPFVDSTNSVHYYPGFSIPTRKELTPPSGTLNVAGSDHGLNTSNLYVGVVGATSTVDRSWESFGLDSLIINESSYDLALAYSLATSEVAYVYYLSGDTVTGTSYVGTLTHSGSPASQTFVISAATHQLDDLSVLPCVYEELAGSREQVGIEAFTVNPSTGDISITIVNSTAAAHTYTVLLSAMPIDNTGSGVVAGGATGTVTLTNLSSPWVFQAIYLEQSPGGIRELVLPDTTMYDDTTKEITISFTNQSATPRNFLVYYTYGAIRNNQLTIDDASIVSDLVDSSPQITIWGLDHETIYQDKQVREGWVTHIDAFRRSGEQRLVSGLGGNLFAAEEYAEAAAAYDYPLLYPRLSARASATINIGPAMWATGEVPARSRGYITGDGGGSHNFTVQSVTFDPSNSWTKYLISVPNKQILDATGTPTSLSSVISTTSGLEDYLSVEQMSYAVHSGDFRIRQILDGSNQITIWVENPDNTADWDDLHTAGFAGINSDQITWTAASPFQVADTISYSTAAALGEVLGSVSNTTTIGDVASLTQVPAGLVFVGARTSSLISLRTQALVPSTEGMVHGDMLSYTGISRLLRVLYVNPNTAETVSVTGDGTTATVTLSSTSHLTEGQKISLLEAGSFSGIYVINTITSVTELQLTSEATGTSTGTLDGLTIEVDEELVWADTTASTNLFRCEERWIPLEAPESQYDLPPTTHVRQLDSNDYTAQPFLRSSMVNDNMYFTNGDDPIYKFDGTNIYRAGLIPWQPALFIAQETTGPAIITGCRTLAYSAISAGEGKLTITSTTQNTLPVGTSVRLSGSTLTYSVANYTDDGTNYFVVMDRALDSNVAASGSANEIKTRRYYVRLNAVDANNNIIASAVTSSQDLVVELTQDASVQLKLVGMPVWDVYDYDRIEAQIYATKLNLGAPFYLVTTIPISFDNTNGYITYRDTFSDQDLTQLDVTSSVLTSGELGIGWSDPLRSKHITSLDNRLIQANVIDWPQIDMAIFSDANLSNATIAGTKLLLRRDSGDAGTTTNMTTRLTLEWVNGVTGSATVTAGSNSFTVAGIAETLSAGDWIYLSYATVDITGRDLTLSGWWQVASFSTGTATINYVGLGTPTSTPDSYTVATDTRDVPVLLGIDGNLGMVNAALFDLFDVTRRSSLALNAVMRMVDTSITAVAGFSPWVISRSGNDTPPAGRILFRQSKQSTSLMSITPTFSGYRLFVNSVEITTGTRRFAIERSYPSRVLVSYQNFPEVFDSPTAALDTQSQSAIDVNSSDGQEITGTIPFFGDAAFTAAQQAGILVVFKTNSIYLVDVNQKALGNNPVQRLETEGLGCTAPYSIAVTANGIMFANESGLYCLRKTQLIEYVGKWMERNWLEQVNRDALGVVQGHHYGIGRKYKISVPLIADKQTNGYVENNEAYVYDHTLDGQVVANTAATRLGAWGHYDNHPATGWANLAQDEYFASSTGRVFSTRRVGDATDARDDNQPINFSVTFRAQDFGNSGVRKVVDALVVKYRAGADSTGTKLNYSVDLESEYAETSPVILRTNVPVNDLSDMVSRDIIAIRHNIGRRRGVYFTIQITNSTIDEHIEIAGIDYKVGGLTEKGITQAAQTK